MDYCSRAQDLEITLVADWVHCAESVACCLNQLFINTVLKKNILQQPTPESPIRCKCVTVFIKCHACLK